MVSVIMPVYNVQAYIAAAIESVLSQSYEDWELIVVNDGSPDRSRDIAADYAKKDVRIKVVDKENGGLSDARNYGLQFVQGDFVHFFDSDDFISPDFYEQMISHFTDKDDFIVSGYYVEKEVFGKVVAAEKKICPSLSVPLTTPDQQVDAILPYLDFAWNKIYRRSFLQSAQLFFQKGLSRVEDCEFISRVLKHHSSFSFIDYAGYHYMVRNRETLSNFFDVKMLDDMLIRLQSVRSIYSCLGCSSLKSEQLLSRCAESSARAYLSQLFSACKGWQIKRLYDGVRALLQTHALIALLRREAAISSVLNHCMIHRRGIALMSLYWLKTYVKKK